MNNNQVGLRKMLSELMVKIYDERDKIKNGNSDYTSIETINYIIKELENMQKAMSPKIFKPTYSYVVVDSCDTPNPLSEELLQAFSYYMKIN